MGAVEMDMPFILHIIIIAQDTGRCGIIGPGHCSNSQGVGMRSGAGHAANFVTRKLKRHVFGKDVWRMHDQGLLCRESAPLMITYH